MGSGESLTPSLDRWAVLVAIHEDTVDASYRPPVDEGVIACSRASDADL